MRDEPSLLSRRRLAWRCRSVALAFALVSWLGRLHEATAAGQLMGGLFNEAPIKTLNLSACGTLDWALWQSPNPENSADLGWDVVPVKLHKRGASQISDLSFIGIRDPGTTQEHWASQRSVATYTWTDSEMGAGESAYGVVIGSEQGFGFSFSVPASQDTRQLDVYYECRGSAATFNANITTALAPFAACMTSVTGVQHVRLFWNDSANPLVVTLTGSAGPSAIGVALFGVTLNLQPFPYGTPPLPKNGCDATKASGNGGAGGGPASGGTGGGGTAGRGGSTAGPGTAGAGTGGGVTGAGGVGGRGVAGGRSGGSATGGSATGGVATGGSATGGVATGGLPGGSAGARGGASEGGRGMGGLASSGGGGVPFGASGGTRTGGTGGSDVPSDEGPGPALACAASPRALGGNGWRGEGLLIAGVLIPWLRRRRRSRTS